MPRVRSRSLGLVFALLFFLGQPTPGLAQSAACIESVLVIDQSWSMWNPEKTFLDENGQRRPVNDPEHLRLAAARLYLDLAEDGDRVAFVFFGENAWSLPGTEFAGFTVLDPLSRPRLKEAISTMSERVEPATNTPAALLLASQYFASARLCPHRYLILLTDGVPFARDQSPAQLRAATLAAAQTLAQQGVQVISLLLGSAVDRALAEEIARISRGDVLTVPEAEHLLDAFSRLIARQRPTLYQNRLTVTPTGVSSFLLRPEQRVHDFIVVFSRHTAQGPLLERLTLDDRVSLSAGCALSDAIGSATCVIDPNYHLVRIQGSVETLRGRWLVQSRPGQALNGLLLARSTLAVELRTAYYPAGQPTLFLSFRLTEGGRPVVQTRADVVVEGEGLGQTSRTLRSDLFSDDGQLYWATVPAPTRGPLRLTVHIGDSSQPLQMTKEFTLWPDTSPCRLDLTDGPAWAEITPGPCPVHEAKGVLVQGSQVVASTPLQLQGSQLVSPTVSPTLCSSHERHVLAMVSGSTGPLFLYAHRPFAQPNDIRLHSQQIPDPITTRLPRFAYPLAWAGSDIQQDLLLRARWQGQDGRPLGEPPLVRLETGSSTGQCTRPAQLVVDQLNRLAPGTYTLTLEFAHPAGLPVQPATLTRTVHLLPPRLIVRPETPDLGVHADPASMTGALLIESEPPLPTTPDLRLRLRELRRDGEVLPPDQRPLTAYAGPLQPAGDRWRLPIHFSPRDFFQRWLLPPGYYEAQFEVTSSQALDLQGTTPVLAWRAPGYLERIHLGFTRLAAGVTSLPLWLFLPVFLLMILLTRLLTRRPPDWQGTLHYPAHQGTPTPTEYVKLQDFAKDGSLSLYLENDRIIHNRSLGTATELVRLIREDPTTVRIIPRNGTRISYYQEGESLPISVDEAGEILETTQRYQLRLRPATSNRVFEIVLGPGEREG